MPQESNLKKKLTIKNDDSIEEKSDFGQDSRVESQFLSIDDARRRDSIGTLVPFKKNLKPSQFKNDFNLTDLRECDHISEKCSSEDSTANEEIEKQHNLE